VSRLRKHLLRAGLRPDECKLTVSAPQGSLTASDGKRRNFAMLGEFGGMPETIGSNGTRDGFPPFTHRIDLGTIRPTFVRFDAMASRDSEGRPRPIKQ